MLLIECRPIECIEPRQGPWLATLISSHWQASSASFERKLVSLKKVWHTEPGCTGPTSEVWSVPSATLPSEACPGFS